MRQIVVAVGVAVLWLLGSVSVASAASETVDCAGLQAALNQAVNGDTITLDQLCTKSNSGASDGTFTAGAASITLEAKPGSGAGFDGMGVGSPILSDLGHASSYTLSIKGLVFENGPNGALFLGGISGLDLVNDSFRDNKASLGGAVGLSTFEASPATVTIENSLFQGNHAALEGGAVYIDDSTASTGTPPPIVLSGNTFRGNAVNGAGTSGWIGGGALFVEAFGIPPVVTQTANRFLGNSVTGGTGDAWGGAEFVEDAQLRSTDDVFTGNSIQAPAGSNDSAGSALSILNEACSVSRLVHVARNLVMADNTILIGPSGTDTANAWGALYLGCTPLTGPNNLILINSTISANKGDGTASTAGIWGDASDHLTLENSILAGDSDGGELFGFNGTGGSVTVNHTDLCRGTSPFAGARNICATPRLVNPVAGNVRETYASPTIDRGLNTLVPSGLTTDVYGAPRIAPKLSGGTPNVDMGAAEFSTLDAPTITITKPVASAHYKRHRHVHSAFTCTETTGGPGIASCKTAAGASSGALISTSKIGRHHFAVIAISRDGLKTTKTITYTVRRG